MPKKLPKRLKLDRWIEACLGMALIAVSACAQAQGIYKCVGKDGKIAYSNDPCPGSKQVGTSSRPPAVQGADANKDSSTRTAAGAVDIPKVQAGKWRLHLTRVGRASDAEICGDPLVGFREKVKAYAATTKKGCTLTTSPAGPRSVSVVYDCPSDRAKDGSRVQKGRTEMLLVSSWPQAFRLETKSPVNPGSVMEGAWVGECTK
jgi:hypothetical protein